MDFYKYKKDKAKNDLFFAVMMYGHYTYCEAVYYTHNTKNARNNRAANLVFDYINKKWG